MPELYNYVRKGTVSLFPENLHLIFESSYDSNYCYFVNSANNKQLIKMNMTDRSTSIVETRTNKDIARGFLDRDTDEIYFVDCEYNDSVSYIWKINLSNDSVTEIESIPADVFDVWRYSSETYILYFSVGYTLESGNVTPNGDVTTEWSSTGANHYTEIDDNPASPSIVDNISAGSSDGLDDTFTMSTIDMTGYDAAGVVDQVYQIQCYVWGKEGASPDISGNKTGMTSKSVSFSGSLEWHNVIWSGLSLDQADLDDLEITIISDSAPFQNQQIGCMYCKIYFYGDESNALTTIKNLDTEDIWTQDMGVNTGRSWRINQFCQVGTDFYFLFHWSDENVELWRFRTVEEDFTQIQDAGSTTEITTVEKGAISVDNTPDYMYFVLETGTKEVCTIVADTQANITDETYFTIYVIQLDYENVRSEYIINCWFDKAGDSTWTADPATADENIQIDISGDVSAQDVSDTITASLNAHELVGATNGGGTSTTVTITNHYNGNVTNINARDSGLSVATTTPGVAGTPYLFTYSIVSDVLTNTGSEYNIALMLNRNTNSSATPECFALEKGFGLTTGANGNALKYFIISRHRGALNFLGQFYATYPVATYPSARIRAITDNYIFIDDGT